MALLNARNILLLVAAAGAYVLFTRAGGATGIGTRIGGGLSSFSTGVTTGLAQAGSTWGGLFDSWGSSFVTGLNQLGASITGSPGTAGGGGNPIPNVAPTLPAPTQSNASVGDVIQQLGLGENVVHTSYNPQAQLTESDRSLLQLAGVFQSLNLGHDVDLERQLVVYDRVGLGEQDLSQALTPSGEIRTGREGLSPSTIEAQQRLAKEYGIITFDVTGAISNVGGYTAAV